MDNSQRDPHRPQPQVLQVPEFPRLVCIGQEILERAHCIQQSYAEVLRSLVGDVDEFVNRTECEARRARDNGDPADHDHFTEIYSPK